MNDAQETPNPAPVPDTRPTEAVSITYDAANPAPVISDRAAGERAEAVIAMARELGIYVHRDPLLLQELRQLREGEAVPEQLYTVIATILAFSYLLQGKTPEIFTRADGTKAVNIES